ncbi:cytochrome c-type biogenesis protein CcmH [Kushneria avicenniae]|uniref:Cytochrome c-type biogenesis protein CcmH n=1 Tax=Kushneria avicenniae TaxID=402385 RepID=A0A1I1LIJ0_9GAMM|nr:c-type cytochrome biogenesis protein CcmI [Kushneria avicenniae]SFC72934.1 cytochrome c-type biogenesis protein CcmH [Kushneria avicenniae]
MTALWVGLALLLSVAIVFLLLPLWRSRGLRAAQSALETRGDETRDNVTVFRERLAALDEELARGEIDQARYDTRQLELERDLLADTDARAPKGLKSTYSGLWLTIIVVVVVGFGSLYAYYREGSLNDLSLYQAREQVEQNGGQPQQFIARFEQEAQRQPDNPNVWASLYPLYRDSQQYDRADHALTRLIELKGREPSLVSELAQIRFVENDRQMNDEIQALADEVLADDPRQPTVHGLLGFADFSDGNYQGAIDHWRIAIAGSDSEGSQQALRQAMAAARARMGPTADGAPVEQDSEARNEQGGQR